MDILSDYRITSLVQREQQLAAIAERSRIAAERAALPATARPSRHIRRSLAFLTRASRLGH